jgi:hypothetical protein
MGRYGVESYEREATQNILKNEYGIEIKGISLPNQNELSKRLQNLKEYGFSKEDISLIVKRFPQVLGCKAERTKKVLLEMEKLFCKQQVIEMIRTQPQILGLTVERISEVIDWLNRNQIKIDINTKPSILLFSVKTLEERRKKLEEIGFNYKTKPDPLTYGTKTWERFLNKRKASRKKPSRHFLFHNSINPSNSFFHCFFFFDLKFP